MNQNHHHKDDCCFCCSLPDCSCLFKLRLGGLTSNLAFELFREKGCQVTVEFDGSSGRTERETGRICNVGTDFVDLRRNNNTVVTLFMQRISRINWTDPNCNPCKQSVCTTADPTPSTLSVPPDSPSSTPIPTDQELSSIAKIPKLT